MKTITLNRDRTRHHALDPETGRAICGGGYGGRSAHYQEEFGGEIDCAACRQLLYLPPLAPPQCENETMKMEN